MRIDAHRVELEAIAALREHHRREMACQIVHDSLHARGFTHMYALDLDGRCVAYGTVVGFGDEPKETVDEFFVLPEGRAYAAHLFQSLIDAAGARRIQAQTNDRLLTLMLFDRCAAPERDRILFEHALDTRLTCPGATFARTTPAERELLSPGQPGEAADYKLEVGGEIVGTGGILFHYNPPYGDLNMEVGEAHRRQGFGSYLVQELVRTCRSMGKVPAARCNDDNVASRATLQRAGMLPCASILTGTITR